uniref:zinc finger CCCH domain-containing protein 30-like n=1 Tax=Erigeron canadensis TaxID=72917 RepID=UPI001CB8E17D|nr:zinc finger CCCH domain-containing protein 30-like [Erigeron canadensis]
MVDPDWKMEDGSESQEKHIQLKRELKTTEAFYTFNFNIPPNPSVASDALDFDGDDSKVPIIPLEVIDNETSPEDDGTSLITLSPGVEVGEITIQPLSIPLTPQENKTPEVGKPLLQRDEVIAAAVALTALMKFKEPGNYIDLELLIQLLRNPGMLEHLMKHYGPSVNQRPVTICAQPHERPSVPLPVSSPASNVHHPAATGTTPLSVNSPRTPVSGYNTCSPSVPCTNSIPSEVKNTICQVRKAEVHGNSSKPLATMIPGPGPGPNSPTLDMAKFRKLINEYGVPSGGETLTPEKILPALSSPRSGPVVMKDSEYYRKLVSQHGIVQESPNPQGSVKSIGMIPVESKPHERPCMYYNSNKGCRRGSSCWFPHVNLERGSPVAKNKQGAKRMKLSGGNFARRTCH